MALGAIAQGLSVFAEPAAASLVAWAAGLLAVILGLALLIGFLTPVAGAIATISYFVTGVWRLLAAGAHRDPYAFTALNLAVMAASLVLLGPGAISLDARLYGRREIIIPESRRPPQ